MMSEHLLNDTVSHLSLAISLGVETGTQVLRYVQVLTQGSPELADPQLVPVRDELLWEAVESKDMPEVQVSKLFRSDAG